MLWNYKFFDYSIILEICINYSVITLLVLSSIFRSLYIPTVFRFLCETYAFVTPTNTSSCTGLLIIKIKRISFQCFYDISVLYRLDSLNEKKKKTYHKALNSAASPPWWLTTLDVMTFSEERSAFHFKVLPMLAPWLWSDCVSVFPHRLLLLFAFTPLI